MVVVVSMTPLSKSIQSPRSYLVVYYYCLQLSTTTTTQNGHTTHSVMNDLLSRSHRHDGSQSRSGVREEVKVEKDHRNYLPTGILATDEGFKKQGVVVKYSEPPEARAPLDNWVVYAFDAEDEASSSPLLKGMTLFGREKETADVWVDDKSCSKQHAVIQFRQKSSKNKFGDVSIKIQPYLFDLDSANGTFLNGEKIKSGYVKLLHKDIITFGFHPVDFVLMKVEK
jgi:smad nuclear-interacting protein 1